MKTTYYTPTTVAMMVEPYIMQHPSSTPPEGDPATPVPGTPTAPARKLYV